MLYNWLLITANLFLQNPILTKIVSMTFKRSLSHCPTSLALGSHRRLAGPTTDDCWDGEPATCGPSIQTVGTCGNILVGRLFTPHASPRSAGAPSSRDSKPRGAVTGSRWTLRCRWTRPKEKRLHAAFLWPPPSCFLSHLPSLSISSSPSALLSPRVICHNICWIFICY